MVDARIEIEEDLIEKYNLQDFVSIIKNRKKILRYGDKILRNIKKNCNSNNYV